MVYTQTTCAFSKFRDVDFLLSQDVENLFLHRSEIVSPSPDRLHTIKNRMYEFTYHETNIKNTKKSIFRFYIKSYKTYNFSF